jgi:hypothetical protein
MGMGLTESGWEVSSAPMGPIQSHLLWGGLFIIGNWGTDPNGTGLQVNGDQKGVRAGPYALSHSLSLIEAPKALQFGRWGMKGIVGR